METPAVYLPEDRRQAYARGQELPERADGSALFADISGFTPLTEMLARALGPRRGAEELTRYLNGVYDTLIAELHRYGGSVISFSGDAITCWFNGDDGRRATATALAMQRAIARYAALPVAGGGTVALAMKAAVATGPVRRFVVGDPGYTLLDAAAGATLERLATAEHHAGKGEVVLDAGTARALQEHLHIVEWRRDEEFGYRFAVVEALTLSVPESPWPPLAPDALSEAQVRPWLLPAVYQRLHTGSGEFLAELRPAVALFLRFGGIDYDRDEAAPAKLDSFIQRVEQSLSRYSGSLLQLTIGDKGSYLYAAFGAPVAHEDDVERAAAAALELRETAGALPYLGALQIGLAYGRMRVGAYGSTVRRTYGVLGDAVNLAARLMQAAGPGQILVSDEIRTRGGADFVWEPLAPIQVKGKSELVAIARLVRAATRRAGSSLEVLFPSAPIGRQALQQTFQNCLASLSAGQGQVVRLLGEAGMGKSHLAAHFCRLALAQGVRLALGQSQSLTQNTAYLPWRQVFQSLLQLDEASGEDALAQLTERVTSQNPDWALRLPLLGDLLSLPIPDNPTTRAMDGDLRQKSLFSLLVEMVQSWAAQQPLILLIDNAQWLDEASLALTQTLAQQAAATAPVMVFLAHRPPLLGSPPLLRQLAELPGYTELRLPEMTAEDVAAQIQRQLDGTPTPLLREVVKVMARGNPFFVRELVEAMRQGDQLTQAEAGVWDVSETLLAALRRVDYVTQVEGQWQLKPQADLSSVSLGVPDSIHKLILSRLDRLPESHKLTLKVSSVLGHYIDLLLVAQVHPETKAVAEIEAEAEYMEVEEVIREDTPTRKLYAFRHHTTQEVAYDTLLFTQRQQLHRAVATALTELEPDAYPQIAHHAYLGELWPLALRYNLLAGERAKQLYANQQSIDFFQKALRSAQALPEAETAEPRKRIHLALGELLVMTDRHEAAREHLAAAVALAQAQGDWEAEALACRWYGRSQELRGEYAAALEWLDKGFAVLKDTASVEAAELSLNAALVNIRQGNYDQALALCERSLAVAEARDDGAVRARTYNTLGVVDRRRGNSRAAIERFTQSLGEYERLQNVYGQATSHNLIANGVFMQDEWSRADAHYRRSLDLFIQIGSGYNQVLVNNNLGGIALKQGRLDAALGYYQGAARLLEQIGGSRWVLGALHMNTGHVYLERGDLEAAADYLQRAADDFERAQVRDLLPELYGLFAEAALRRGELAPAADHGQRALALARSLRMPREEGHTLAVLGEIAAAQGQAAEAEQHFADSRRLLEAAGDEYEAARTDLAAARFYTARSLPALAGAALDRCTPVFTRLGARADLEAAEALRAQLGA